MGNRAGCLNHAAKQGHLEECTKLVNDGVDVNDQNNLYKSSALNEACRYGHHDVAAFLIKHGAIVTSTDCIGRTPLHNACQGGFNSIIQILLDAKSDVNSIADQGEITPLHLAVENGHKVAVLLLLEHGADLSIMNSEGRTAFQLAAIKGTFKTILMCYAGFESVFSSEVVASINIDDENVEPKSRVVLTEWLNALQLGSQLSIPKKQIFEDSIEQLVAFFKSTRSDCSHWSSRRRKRKPSKHESEMPKRCRK